MTHRLLRLIRSLVPVRWWLQYAVLMVCFVAVSGCRKPIDSFQAIERIGVVSIHYDPNIYTFEPHQGIEKSKPYAPFSWQATHVQVHERILGAWLDQFITQTQAATGVAIVRSPMLMNTTLMQDPQVYLQFEHALVPYDPIDMVNGAFLSGLSNQLGVNAVMHIHIAFAIQLDQKMLWDEYKDPFEPTVSSYRMQVKDGHKTSRLRTQIALVVVDERGNRMYDEVRYVDTNSDTIRITSADLNYDGGVSPSLIQQGLSDWLANWRDYL